MKALFIGIAIAAGVGSAIGSGSNGTLQKSLVSPLWTVLAVATVSIVAGVPLALAFGGPAPTGAQLGSAPWWAWLGGLCGLLFLFATVVVSPRLGAGTFVAVIVTSSTLMALVLDHYGLMNFEVHPTGIGRLVGIVLMIAGVGCIAMF